MLKKIGLTQRVENLPDRNERRDCLDQAWTTMLLDCGYTPVPLPNLTTDVPELLRAYGLGGLILTGGNDIADLPGARNTAPERDRFETLLLRHSAQEGMPLLGVCRGLQMLMRHYGGTLSPVGNHVACRHPLIVEDAPGAPLTDRDEINSFHDFGIARADLGSELVVLASAPDGSIEAVRHQRYNQWGIMWHPERDPSDPRDATLIRKIFG